MSPDTGIAGTDGFKPRFNGGVPKLTPPVAHPNLSFIEDHEQIQAQSVIDEQFRALTKCAEYPAGITFREHARLTRYFCAVKIYVRPEELKEITADDGTKTTLYLPDTVRAEDRYQSCCGLVIGLGPQAFKDKDGNPRTAAYRVADWVVFPRTDIIRVDFAGIPIGVMTDDRAVIVTDDPTLWAQGSLIFKA